MTEARGRVALTGGTGFLGRHIVDALVADGWRVRRLVRRPQSPVPGTETVPGSLFDDESLDRLLEGTDVLVHAAGLIKARSPAEFMHVNRDGSRRLAQAAARLRLRVVVVSSLAAREPALSSYAESKRAGEDAFRDAAGDNLVILRPTAIYGPGDRETGRLLRAADAPIMPIPKAPEARVSLIYAADAAAAVAAVCRKGPAGHIFELSDARADGYRWRELAEAVLAAAGSSARILEIPAVVFRIVASLNAVAGRLTGKADILGPGKVRELFHPDWSIADKDRLPEDVWLPGIDLRDGLAKTFAWLRSGLVSRTEEVRCVG